MAVCINSESITQRRSLITMVKGCSQVRLIGQAKNLPCTRPMSRKIALVKQKSLASCKTLKLGLCPINHHLFGIFEDIQKFPCFLAGSNFPNPVDHSTLAKKIQPPDDIAMNEWPKPLKGSPELGFFYPPSNNFSSHAKKGIISAQIYLP